MLTHWHISGLINPWLHIIRSVANNNVTNLGSPRRKFTRQQLGYDSNVNNAALQQHSLSAIDVWAPRDSRWMPTRKRNALALLTGSRSEIQSISNTDHLDPENTFIEAFNTSTQDQPIDRELTDHISRAHEHRQLISPNKNKKRFRRNGWPPSACGLGDCAPAPQDEVCMRFGGTRPEDHRSVTWRWMDTRCPSGKVVEASKEHRDAGEPCCHPVGFGLATTCDVEIEKRNGSFHAMWTGFLLDVADFVDGWATWIMQLEVEWCYDCVLERSVCD